jgi:hypothetical protein
LAFHWRLGEGACSLSSSMESSRTTQRFSAQRSSRLRRALSLLGLSRRTVQRRWIPWSRYATNDARMSGSRARRLKTSIENKLAELVRRLIMLLRREQFDRELEEEMRLHRELREQEHVELGSHSGDHISDCIMFSTTLNRRRYQCRPLHKHCPCQLRGTGQSFRNRVLTLSRGTPEEIRQNNVT